MGYADTVGGRLNANLDAAKANFGGDWRMPTDADIDALVANTTAVWTTPEGACWRCRTRT